MFFQNEALADNKEGCRWWDTFEPGFRQFSAQLPASVKLKEGAVGSVLFTSSTYYITNVYAGCDSGYGSTERVSLTSGMKLADGFSNVYETGVSGIGIRFSLLNRQGRKYVPYEFKYPRNGSEVWGTIIYDFVKTDAVVRNGVADINATFQHSFNGDWNSSDLKVSGTIKIENERRITSCVSIGDTLIRMGAVDASVVGTTAGRDFSLQAKCNHDGPSGQPLPVKVYFEGDTAGPGRLNLAAGGAQGIEISLTDDTGRPMPFSEINAVNMTSPDTTTGNYMLRVNAEYVQKPGQKIIPGQANATLNYIFEYN